MAIDTSNGKNQLAAGFIGKDSKSFSPLTATTVEKHPLVKAREHLYK